MHTPANMTIPQFMVSASTGIAIGKKAKTNIGSRNAMEAMLIAIPYFPSDQRRAGSGSPLHLLCMRQPIVTMYEDISDEIVIELIALRATGDPMLIMDTIATIRNETMIALSGMFSL
jgi:hypothetical protein